MTEDIHCPICGEPWDRYGVTHGDMTQAEAAAFYRGEGCPACAYGTRQHERNTHPRPGILAQRVQAEKQKTGQVSPDEESSLVPGTDAPASASQQKPVKRTLQECQQIAQAIGWTIRDLGSNVYFYSNETFGAHAREDEYEGVNEIYNALARIQQKMQEDEALRRRPAMMDISAVREHFKPNENAIFVSPLYLVWKKLYHLALQCSSTEKFLVKARSLPEEQHQADQYWRTIFIENVEKGEIVE